MGIEFFQTVMGKRFYEGTLPNVAKNLEALNANLAKANENEEKRLELEERKVKAMESAVEQLTKIADVINYRM